jgi:hypothetical protein
LGDDGWRVSHDQRTRAYNDGYWCELLTLRFPDGVVTFKYFWVR